ncbi:MAG: type II secretion system protein GspL [Chromatiales bacterium]|nr:type II secretion system protein GspL [Chromatiales bacterium]
MTDRILIYLNPTVSGEYRWVVSGMDGTGPRAEQGSLELAAARARGNRVTALASARDVLLTRASLPSLNRQRLRQAVPFALEDHLATEVDDLHFALGGRDESGDLAVAVIDRERLGEGLERLSEAGISCDSVVPEPLALPREPGQWTIWADGDRAVVRSGDLAGFETDTDNLESVLQLAWQAAGEKPGKVILIGAGELPIPDLEETELSVHRHNNALDPLGELAREVAARRSGLDLLQGDFSASEQMGQVLRPWWGVLAALLIVLFVQLGSMAVENHQMSARIEAMDQEIQTLFREALPDVRNIVDPRVQMQRALEKLQAGNSAGPQGFLGLVAGASSILSSQPGLKLQGIAYRDGRLDIDLKIGDLQALDRLKQLLTQDGAVGVDIVTARSRDNQVDARIRLQEANT